MQISRHGGGESLVFSIHAHNDKIELVVEAIKPDRGDNKAHLPSLAHETHSKDRRIRITNSTYQKEISLDL